MKYNRFITIAIITSIGLLLLNNCRKEIIRETLIDTIASADKKIILNLYQNPFQDFYNSGENIIPTSLLDFTISDYVNVDSVFFIINGLKVINNVDQNAVDTMSLELVDMNTNNYILNSKISATSLGVSDYLSSLNLNGSFPTYRINVGIKVSFSGGGNDSWILRNSFLVLKRK